MKMIRRTKMNINYSNSGKLEVLDNIFAEAKIVINKYIDVLWKDENFSSKFIDFKIDDTWLSARMQQTLGKQALEIVKSQRKRRKKHKPFFNKNVINLDSRFIDIKIEDDENSEFDVWIKINSVGNKISLKLPSKKHKHFNKFFDDDWTLKKSSRLIKDFNDNYFMEFFFEKEKPEMKSSGKTIGVDIGYKKLIITSENEVFDVGLEEVYEKISRKVQGSKRFKKALKERDNKINQSVNAMNLEEVRAVVAEDLKNVKKNSKGKIYKKFNNKLQRWSYPKVLEKLSFICEEQGIHFEKVNPAYTSQSCSKCGHTSKRNRSGERFHCTKCGFDADADFNASINIKHRGVYSPSSNNKIKKL